MSERRAGDAGDAGDGLDPLIEALRDTPEGPGPEAAADTLAAVRRAVGRGAVPKDHAVLLRFVQRIVSMTYTHRKAAAVITLGVAGAAAWLALASFASVSYADVSKRIRDLQSLTCTSTASVPGMKEPVTAKMMYLGGKTRNEVVGRVTVILDRDAKQALALNPAMKTAHLIKYDVTGPPTAGGAVPRQIDMVAELRRFADKKGEPIGEQRIGDVNAKGFRAEDGGRQMNIWVDPRSGAPLRIEMDYEQAGGVAKVVITDIVFDAPLDEKLFSLDVPAGYALTKMDMAVTLDLQENVVGLLRLYSEKSGGRFPAALDWGSIAPVATEGDNPAKYDAASPQFMSYAGTIAGLTSQLERGKDYDYRPGVTAGDAEAIVFWHRDKEKGTYRAVRGDLSVADLKAEDVPAPVKETLPTPVRVEPGAAGPRPPAPPIRVTPEAARPSEPAPAAPPKQVTPETAPAEPE